MRHRIIGRVFLSALIVASVTMTGADQSKGRFKKQGDNCVWDSNDTGPNQCTPLVRGRFKKDGDSCKWMPDDSGEDQCRPVKGRFKTENGRCVWSADDSGPDQCNPHRAK